MLTKLACRMAGYCRLLRPGGDPRGSWDASTCLEAGALRALPDALCKPHSDVRLLASAAHRGLARERDSLRWRSGMQTGNVELDRELVLPDDDWPKLDPADRATDVGRILSCAPDDVRPSSLLVVPHAALSWPVRVFRTSARSVSSWNWRGGFAPNGTWDGHEVDACAIARWSRLRACGCWCVVCNVGSH